MTENVVAQDENSGEGKRLELLEHLTELRSRLVRCIIYISIGSILGWLLYDRAFVFLSEPVRAYLKHGHGSLIQTDILGGFMIKMQVSLLIGLIVVMPLVTLELWGFVSPGLTRTERRGVLLMAPLSILLFLLGVAVAYFILPAGICWLLNQNPPGVQVMPQVQSALLFILKMGLAFGLVFQLPVILMFLAKVGIVTSKMLTSYWRHSVVIIAIVSAVVTPSNDAFSMSMMCVPMVILYFLSIGLVRIVERRSARR